MAGSSFGELFRFTTWGESHGPAIGVVVDGVPVAPPAGGGRDPALARPAQARPVQVHHAAAASRTGSRSCPACSRGVTTGTPVSLLIRNEDQRSKDYGEIKDLYRPGPRRHHLRRQVRHPRPSRRRPRPAPARPPRASPPAPSPARSSGPTIKITRLSRSDRAAISSIAIGSTWPRSSATRSGARTPPRRNAGRSSSPRSARPARRWVP